MSGAMMHARLRGAQAVSASASAAPRIVTCSTSTAIRSFSTSPASSPRPPCVGILREVKNKWERRTPLVPSDVRALTQSGVRVLVQPSPKRIFTDDEFRSAGAELTDDLSAANTIFGVKEFPKESLLPNASYMIFSHTIKAQAYNMAFLDECLERRVRLFDYEVIRARKEEGGQRLVAFGQFAGIAGMIDGMRGLGERLLSLGYSSPFMGVSSSYMYPDLDAAKEAVERCGREIARVGVPSAFAPMRFAFTGKGNVSTGAQSIFELLPHEWVAPEDLHRVPADKHKVYGTIVTAEHMVQHKGGARQWSSQHYYANPSEYQPVFHKTLAPHISVLVNCMYWDPRFPRLLTFDQLRELARANPTRFPLLTVADITCDIDGSVECLNRSSTIERPFYMYDPLKHTWRDTIEGDGVLMLGVDNLPAEFPREASLHFSSKLRPFVKALASLDANTPLLQQHATLPPEIFNSCIAADGRLTPNFEYIARLREANAAHAAVTAATTASAASAAAAASSTASAPASSTAALASAAAAAPATASTGVTTTLLLEGHLFDSGFINQALDVFETHGQDFAIQYWDISPNREARKDNVSRAVIRVHAESEAKMSDLISAVQTLASVMKKAQAKISRLDFNDSSRVPAGAMAGAATAGGATNTTTTTIATTNVTARATSSSATSSSASSSRVAPVQPKRVLVFGSGFVAAPLVEWLSLHHYEVTVASNVLRDATQITEHLSGATAVEVNVNDVARVEKLITQSDLVVSLLPATMHVPIAELCVKHTKHLVTASYVSAGMEALNGAARERGITLLNEVGLDPGLDHMSAMKLMDHVREQGGRITSFESWCGGLPAPEAADNPFGYKFSWSPFGVLNATRRPTSFLRDSKRVEIQGIDLMRSAKRFVFNPALNLEEYSNGHAMTYVPKYGLDNVHTMYRGTLRFRGTAALMDMLARLGFMSAEPVDAATTTARTQWHELSRRLLGVSGPAGSIEAAITQQLAAAGVSAEEIERGIEAFRWLGLFSTEPIFRRNLTAESAVRPTPLDFLCKVMEDKLAYRAHERDLVLMFHRFEVAWADGRKEQRTSSLISFGGDGKKRIGGGHEGASADVRGSGGGLHGYSAMARTVGLPTAMAADLVLQGRAGGRGGVVIPTTKEFYEPILRELEKESVVFSEQVVA